MKIGIGIPTFNRWQSLERVLIGIRNTSNPDVICVSDDGSTDKTSVVMSIWPDVIYLRNSNGGIARNKNRLLFRLFVIERCDVVILLEDDTIPAQSGWLELWADDALTWGSVSNGVLEDGSEMGSSSLVSAQVWAIYRETFYRVGYLDLKFKTYGYEHLEWQRREALAGTNSDGYMGEFGFMVRVASHFKQNGECASTGTRPALEHSERVYKETAGDTGYKPPCEDWPVFLLECLTDEEKALIGQVS